MNRINLKTDGTNYKCLVSLYEKQLDNLKQYEEREKKAAEARKLSVWDTLMSYNEAPADTTEQADELLRRQAQTEIDRKSVV